MSGGDFMEPEDQGPAKNQAPKPVRLPTYDYKAELRRERIRVLVWLLFWLGVFIGGIVLWHRGWRP